MLPWISRVVRWKMADLLSGAGSTSKRLSCNTDDASLCGEHVGPFLLCPGLGVNAVTAEGVPLRPGGPSARPTDFTQVSTGTCCRGCCVCVHNFSRILGTADRISDTLDRLVELPHFPTGDWTRPRYAYVSSEPVWERFILFPTESAQPSHCYSLCRAWVWSLCERCPPLWEMDPICVGVPAGQCPHSGSRSPGAQMPAAPVKPPPPPSSQNGTEP